MTFPETVEGRTRYRLSVDDFLCLDASGAFARHAKTELIGGEVFVMNAQHRPHARLKSLLYRRIADALDAIDVGLEALVEASVAMPPFDTPEPDIVLTYLPAGEGPVPLGSVALIIEVAEASLENDLGAKAALYASKGVPEYWVADVSGRLIHQMWSPDESDYLQRRTIPLGEPITAVTIDGLAVETTGL